MTDLNFKDVWFVYFHDYMDTNWNRESYEIITKIDNVINFWTTFNIIKHKLSLGMFFFMKENIFPKWDDNDNKDFSFLSFKILKTDVETFIEQILIRLFNNTLIEKTYTEYLSGISISPKKNFCILKIWVSSTNDVLKSTSLYDIPKSYHGDILFKNNLATY